MVFSRARKRAKGSSYSASYSDGSSAIDLQSDEYRSDTEDRPDVYSPIHEDKKPKPAAYFSMGSTCPHALDAVTFSDYDLFLDTPSSIRILGDEEPRKARSQTPLRRLVTFDNRLFSLAEDGCVYELHEEDFALGEWRWSRVDWLPEAVTSVSSTYDDKNLWVQTKTKGYLYNENHIAVEEEPMRGRVRVYGYTCADYLTLDCESGTVAYGDIRVAHVQHALLDSHNRLYVLLEKDSSRYSSICFLRWTPTYMHAR